jgi:hypothetical protein
MESWNCWAAMDLDGDEERIDRKSMGGNTRRTRELTCSPFTTEIKKKRQFRKFSYRGIELEQYVRPSLSP